MRSRKIIKYFLSTVVVIFAIIFIVSYLGLKKVPALPVKSFGVTYSARFAEKFGLDRREVYLAVLDDLGAKSLRLPIYWDEIEPEDNVYDFREVDFQMLEAQKRDAKVILAIGRKLPRWPECFRPDWVLEGESERFEREKLIEFLEVVVERYKNSEALLYWQVENEPFLPFGDSCFLMSAGFLEEEVALVKNLDQKHLVLLTDSGELSFWLRAAKRSDIFGTTMYRTIWNENLGYFTYPLPPEFFRVKRALTEYFTGKRPMLVSELQAEPWGPHLLYEENLFPLSEQLSHFNENVFRENIEYARRSGFDEFYLWGVEWWYWLKLNGHPEIWREAKELF